MTIQEFVFRGTKKQAEPYKKTPEDTTNEPVMGVYESFSMYYRGEKIVEKKVETT